MAEVRSERESQDRFVKWLKFPQEIPKIARLNFMLSVRMGTVYWCLDVKRKTVPENSRVREHLGLS